MKTKLYSLKRHKPSLTDILGLATSNYPALVATVTILGSIMLAIIKLSEPIQNLGLSQIIATNSALLVIIIYLAIFVITVSIWLIRLAYLELSPLKAHMNPSDTP
jgi:hypothetical protein